MNLDTGGAATAIPAELSKELKATGYEASLSADVSYKTASAEHLVNESGIALNGTDARGTRKGLNARVTGVHRTLASGARVAKDHIMVLTHIKGGVLVPRNSDAGKEFETSMGKLYAKHAQGFTPVRQRGGLPDGLLGSPCHIQRLIFCARQ